ncbi:hypothetical protein GGR27_003313 [Lewinella antarctica]|uniref:Uncharacterized protein n=1 Tax=Neolewinella antarctica TaxID=442734 RepID=A0ABX0XER4_9BACT|nr:hypothetical protein [Neolewinella antarctica]
MIGGGGGVANKYLDNIKQTSCNPLPRPLSKGRGETRQLTTLVKMLQ